MTVFKPTKGKGTLWGFLLVVFIGALMLIPVGLTMAAGKPNSVFMGIMGITLAIVVLLIGYFTWAAGNMAYFLDKNELVIKWAFNKKKVPLANIKGVRRGVGMSSLKIVGASWPGFHMGSFTDPGGKGSVNMFGTRLWGDIILIRTKWEVIGITPEDPEAFLEELQKLIPGLEADSLGQKGTVQIFSPWKEKKFIALAAATLLILGGTGLYLVNVIPVLPNQVPLHYNLAGEVDRYGSPTELYLPYGIGVGVCLLLFFINGITGRNNRTSAYLMGFVSLFIALLFGVISIGMVISSR